MSGAVKGIAFEDVTCKLHRYTKAYFDCGQSSRLNAHQFFGDVRNDKPFPVFTQHLFKEGGPYPYALFDFKERTGLLDNRGALINPGRALVLRRAISGGTQLFFIWVSHALWEKYLHQKDGNFSPGMHILFHPVGNIGTDYPNYYDQVKELTILQKDNPNDTFYKNNKFYDTNFYELGVRYLFREKQSVLQQRSALLKSAGDPARLLKEAGSGIPLMLIVPVSGITPYFGDLATAATLQPILQAISNFCFDTAQKEKGSTPTHYPTVGRVACSFYSRSGDVAERLMSSLPAFVHEFYLYDVMLDKFHTDKVTQKRITERTQEQGFQLIWRKFKEWKKDSPDKKIRIYSAYPNAVAFIANELKLHKHTQNQANFSAFNNKPDRSGKAKYSGLADGYEIYNADASTSLVSIPLQNFWVYLEDIKNAGGFGMDDLYTHAVGHSWFITRLQTHSLFHSGFTG